MKLLFVFLGGGFGSVLRYSVSKYFNNIESSLPYGTLLVNIIGSFIIGVVIGFTYKSNILTQNQTLFLAVGFCGGFTTFSTFAFENSEFIKNGDYLNFALYSIISIVFGVLAVFLGLFLVK